MATATLGGLIKDYRLQKRISQLEISLSIGWSDTTRLSKIEQGRVGKPNRATIEKIIKALKLSPQEKGEFLLTGGYVPENEEIKRTIKSGVGTHIDNWLYPAYLLDFTWRLLYINDSALKILGLDTSWKERIRSNLINVLSFPFLPEEDFRVKIVQGEDKGHLLPFAPAQIAAFKKENLQFQHEGWYNKLIQQLMQYKDFRKLWPKVDEKNFYKKLYDYEYKAIMGDYLSKQEVLEFHIFSTKLIDDRRFMEILYIPANEETTKIVKKLSNI